MNWINSKNFVPKGKNKSVDNIGHSGHFKVSDFYFWQYNNFDHWSKIVQKVVKWRPMVTIFSGDNSEVLRYQLTKFQIFSTFLKKLVLASLPLVMLHNLCT